MHTATAVDADRVLGLSSVTCRTACAVALSSRMSWISKRRFSPNRTDVGRDPGFERSARASASGRSWTATSRLARRPAAFAQDHLEKVEVGHPRNRPRGGRGGCGKERPYVRVYDDGLDATLGRRRTDGVVGHVRARTGKISGADRRFPTNARRCRQDRGRTCRRPVPRPSTARRYESCTSPLGLQASGPGCGKRWRPARGLEGRAGAPSFQMRTRPVPLAPLSRSARKMAIREDRDRVLLLPPRLDRERRARS